MTQRPDSAYAVIPAVELIARELKQLAEQGEPRFPVDPTTFVEWAQTIRTAKGKSYDLNRYPYQREILHAMADPSNKRVVLMKGIQVGASEALGRVHLGFALHGRITILHLLPTAKHVADYVDSRIRPLLRENLALEKKLGKPNNRGQIHFSRSISLFRGAESVRDVVSIDADLLVLDEVDLLKPENVQEAIRRIAASDLGLIRYAGVPTEPDFGVAALYNQSDQREWHVKCPDCMNAAPLTFEANVVWDESEDGRITNARLACSLCSSVLDPSEGTWIARHPDALTVGFHVSRLMVPNADLVDIILASKRGEPFLRRKFRNNDLGLPYTDGESGLDRATIVANQRAATAALGHELWMPPSYGGPNWVTAGVDVASARSLTLRISEHLELPIDGMGLKRALFIGEVESPEDLIRRIIDYNVSLVCIDSQPEAWMSRALAQALAGRVAVLRVTYADHEVELLKLDANKNHVTAARTPIIDATIEQFRERRNLLPQDLPAQYVEQMTAPRRQVITDAAGRKRARYRSNARDDHLHAEVYDHIATGFLVAGLLADGSHYGDEWPDSAARY